jgi:hypothetical protein
MPSALRSRLTYANVVATLALVFAMSGGALAATHYLITSTKQISPKVLKKLEGREGAAGATGKEGAAGKAGANGASGSNGSNGEGVTVSSINPGEPACSRLGGAKFAAGGKEATACNGKAGTNGLEGEKGAPGESVTSKEFSDAEGPCKEGGSKFESEPGKGKVQTYACNGEKGVIHPGETLPSKATETGTWSYQVAPGTVYVRLPISFPIPLSQPIKGLEVTGFVEHPSKGIHVLREGETVPGYCEGTHEQPTAQPGNICIYQAEPLHGIETAEIDEKEYRYIGNENETVAGLTLVLQESAAKEGEHSVGTWAVTPE